MNLRTDRTADQVAYYDHNVPDPDFEINRPHGESRFYQYLMDFKFARVVKLLSYPLHGARVLAVCCGSGMDAEYLVRAGAQVVAMDISQGCLTRARIRASRWGLDYELVRGDAEALPFPDGAFDVAFVHDGLHHLSNPQRALDELGRVATRAIMVTEPAQANLTRVLVRLKLATQYEEAGNYVARLDPRQLESTSRGHGFNRTASARYLLKYGHPSPGWWHLLDNDVAFLVARAMFTFLGVAMLGRWGNKLAFVAERRPAG